MVEHERLNYGVVVESEKKYNIKLNDEKILCEEWFDTYKINENDERIIIGYKNDAGSLYQYRYGGIYKNGKLTVEPIYDLLLFNEEDTYIAYQNNKSGYIDSRLGMNITPLIFDLTGRFKNGKAYVEYNDLKGYISKDEWKLATSDGIKYNFNLLKWIDENKDFIEEQKTLKLINK